MAVDATSAPGAALRGAGVLAGLQGQTATARPWLDEAAASFATVGDPHREAYALVYIGVTVGQTGGLAAVEPAQRALKRFRELAIALQMLGPVVFHQGEVARAGTPMGGALAALQRDPQALWVARVLELLAMVGSTSGKTRATPTPTSSMPTRADCGENSTRVGRYRW